MNLQVADVFDEYPNPVFIIKPIYETEEVKDFTYIYVNKAFCLFLGRNRHELMGHRFCDVFAQNGERVWLDSFKEASRNKRHLYVEDVSTVIGRKLYTEMFHIESDLCGCIIHDFKIVTDEVSNELRDKANRDFLTGFYNRFYLKEVFNDIALKKNLGITFLDINNLKYTNDMLGHAEGDKLIIKVSAMIRDIYGDSVVFRVGGDEFLIITMNISKDEFLMLSEKSRNAFGMNSIAAIGYRYYDNVESLQSCINQCDALMYENKTKMKRNHK